MSQMPPKDHPEANRYPPRVVAEATDRQFRPGTPERFDRDLEELKRENRQHRQALDGIVGEIHSRMAESPRQRFACDLLSILAANAELVQGVPGGDTWRDLPEMAGKCLEAAGKIYPEPVGQAVLTLAGVFRCGKVYGPHVCARPAGHPGSHASESGLVGWSEEPEFPALGRELHEHGKRVAEYSANDRLYDEENS